MMRNDYSLKRKRLAVDANAEMLNLFRYQQSELETGSWEWFGDEELYLWTDTMFVLHEIAVTADHTISREAYLKSVYPPDLNLVTGQWQKLMETGWSDFYYRVSGPGGRISKLHARGSLISENGRLIVRGTCQSASAEEGIKQVFIRALNQKDLDLKVYRKSEQVAQTGSWQINLSSLTAVYSDNVYRIYGISPIAQPGTINSFNDFIHPDDKTVVLGMMEKSLSDLIPLHVEYRIIRSDGKTRWIRQVSQLLKNSAGDNILAGVIHDITDQHLLDLELRHAHESLRVQNQIFQQAEEVALIGSWTINLNTRRMYFSDNLYRLHGMKPSATTRSFDLFLPFVHAGDREKMMHAYRQIFEKNIPPDIQYRVQLPNGRIRKLKQQGRLIANKNGDSIIIGITQDVTEQDGSLAGLQASNKLLETQAYMFENAEESLSSGSWLWNISTGVFHISSSFYHIYGLKPGSLPSDTRAFDAFLHPDDKEMMEAVWERIASSSEESAAIQYRIYRADGSLRHLRLKTRTFLSGDSERIIAGAIRDVSDEIAAYQQPQHRRHFAEKLSDHLPDIVVVTNAGHTVMACNKKCEQAFQTAKNQIIGHNLFEALPQLNTPMITEHFKRGFEGETVQLQSFCLPATLRYYNIFILPLLDEHDRVEGLLSVFEDVTEEHTLKLKLSDRLHFIEKLLEAQVDCISVLDRDMNFILWNKRCEDFYGRKKEEVIGKNIFDLFPNYRQAPYFEQYMRAFKGGMAHILPGEDHTDREYRETYLTPLLDEHGGLTAVLCVEHDLSEIKTANAQIKASESILKRAEEMAHLASWEYDIPSESLFWSDEMFRLYGYPPQSFDPSIQFFYDTAHPDDQPLVRKLIDTADSLKDTGSITMRIFCVDGRMRYLLTNYSLVKDRSGRILKITGSSLDITDQKMQEENLRYTARSLQIQNQLDRQTERIRHIANWQWSPENNKMIWGENLYRLLNLRPYSFEPCPDDFARHIHPDDRKRLEQFFTDLETGRLGLVHDAEFKFLGNRNEVRHLHFVSKVLYSEDESRMIIGTVQDITHDVQLRKSLETKNLQLEESNSELASFAFVASHDLREPLRKILIFCDRILQKESQKLTDDSTKDIEKIQGAAKRMNELIDDILSFSKFSTVEIQQAPCDLNEILRQVKNDLQDQIDSTRAHITSDILPVVRGTPSHFWQLFKNLVGNALKYQASGKSPVISVQFETAEGHSGNSIGLVRDRSYHKITVTDNGIGFDEQYAKRIFLMFQRLHGKEEYPGSGMGLAICKKIVEFYNGFITAESSEGQGSSFSIYLPEG